MSRPKEPPRIAFRVTEKEKAEIYRLSTKCGLSQSEYSRQRALGYEPRAVLPDAFFVFHEKLCEILDLPPTPDVEKTAIRVFDEIYKQLIDNKKQTAEEIIKEIGGEDLSQQSDSGP